MKRLFQIFVLTILCTTFSCVDLEEEPINQLRTNYFESFGSLRAAVNGTYTVLISDVWERSIQVGSFRVPQMGADDFTTLTGSNKEEWRQFDQFYQSSGNTRLQRSTWALLYDVIRQASWDIEGAASLEGIVNQEAIDQTVAESYFLRAWCYFWLVRTFGEVPIITSTVVNDDIYDVERQSVALVYEQILADLDFAIEHLPEIQSDYGYVNKWAAKAYLAEVHLTMAGWPLNQTEHYAIARDISRDVIQNSSYQLMDDFASIFQPENEGNEELIWSISLCPIDACGGGYTGSWTAKATKPAELNGYQDMYIELSFFERFPEGARKDFTMLSNLKVETGNPADPSYIRRVDGLEDKEIFYNYIDYTQFTTGHPYLKKYWGGFYDTTLVADDPAQPVDPQSPMDIPMMRLAKVYLMYAEAQARADGSPSAESFEFLNQIRRRGKGYPIDSVGTEVDILPGTLGTDDFVRAVVDEKGWELVGELNRWFDLVRTERVEEVNALRSPLEPLPIQNTITKQYYIAPIPATEIAINPRLTQNPGY
ncbi:MAG: RagB/SusD family nutrient uptake outer membrane protein [Cyclobacteriaceae bacterium]